MNLSDQIRASHVPAWLRLLAGVVVIGLIAINGYVIFEGLRDSRRDFWVAAGASLMASALPVVAIGFLATFLDVGVATLQRRTEDVLHKLFPSILSAVFEPPLPPQRDSRLPAHPTPRRRAVVTVGRYERECWANYVITDVGAKNRIELRIEANVRQLNVDVLFDPVVLATAKVSASALADQFAHALAGAVSAGYAVNHEALTRDHGDHARVALVLSRPVDSRFLWDAEEQLYVSQDLMLCLRAMIAERPQLFRTTA